MACIQTVSLDTEDMKNSITPGNPYGQKEEEKDDFVESKFGGL